MKTSSRHGRFAPVLILLAGLSASYVCPNSGVAASAQAHAADAPDHAASESSSPEEHLRTLRAKDPAAAIEQGEPLFRAVSGTEHVAIGLELAGAYIQARRPEDAQKLLDTLTDDPAVAAGDRAKFLTLQMAAAGALHAWKQLDALAAKVESVAAATGDRQVRAGLWSQLGRDRLLQNRFNDAESAYQQALAVEGDEATKSRFDDLQLLGVARAQQGRFPDAISAFSAAEKVATQLGIGDDPTFLSRFGGLFIYTGDWPRAIDYLKRALAAADANPKRMPNRTAIYSNLGTAYDGQKNYEQAYLWFQKSLAYSRERGDPGGHALNNLATVLREWGRDRDALEKFQEAESLAVADGDKEGVAVAAKNIGETLIKLGQRKQAVAPLQRAYDVYAETDQRPKRLELYPVMIENLEALGRAREALALMHEFKQLSDEVVNVESRDSIAKLESDIDLAKKQKELAAAERDSLAKTAAITDLQAQHSRQQLVNYGMFGALTLLAGLLLLLIHDRRLKSRAHGELQAKTDMIESQRRDLEALNEVIRRHSLEDVLTGLGNRRYLAEWMKNAYRVDASSAAAQATRTPSLLILIDLDHFKDVNDRHGHAAGDGVLAAFADLLRNCRRESDLLVRWGGEEFVWLCPDTPVSAGPGLCECIRTALNARPMIVDGVDIALTASMGFAPCPLWTDVASDWQTSIRVADAALYQAKSSGRDRWLGFEPGTKPQSIAVANANPLVLEASGNLVRVAMSAGT